MTAPTEQDLKFFHCQERSALPSNGGMLSTIEIITKVLNNVWPHVLRSAREAGEKLFRKLALKIHQDGDGTLATTEFCFDGPTLGEDRCVLFAATPRDTQEDITDVNGVRLSGIRFYCAGSLAQPITAGTQTVIFNIKDAGDAAGVLVNDWFRLTDKLTPESTSGVVEYHQVATKSVSGTQITLTTVGIIGNNYAAYDTETYVGGKIGIICPAGITAAAAGTAVVTSTAGVFFVASYPILFNNMGADEQELTFDILSGGNFICTSDRHGTLPTGNIGTDYSPLHPHWGKAMCTLEAEVWSGTWLPGDRVVLPLHAAASYCWQERNVPEDCAPMSNNRVILVNRSEGL